MNDIRTIIILLAVLTAVSCEEEYSSLPAVTTVEVRQVSCTSALVDGQVITDGNSSITEKGICWSMSNKIPSVEDNTSRYSGEADRLSCLLDKLEENTRYYARAYAINDNGTSYGTVRSFITGQGCDGTITDADGNVYEVVTIGRQVWMAENLRTTRLNNGIDIIEMPGLMEWEKAKSPMYTWYNNNPSFFVPYGALYNFYAVNTGRLCPCGWHVPTDAEWQELMDYLTENGHYGREGAALKVTKGWFAGGNGNDAYGFHAYPAGMIGSLASFKGISLMTTWWSSTEKDDKAWEYYIMVYDDRLNKYSQKKAAGLSVRCIKD